MREAYQQIDGSMSDTFSNSRVQKRCNLSNYWTRKLPKLTLLQFHNHVKKMPVKVLQTVWKKWPFAYTKIKVRRMSTNLNT